jgi:probable HAF family extracellular repeat protein
MKSRLCGFVARAASVVALAIAMASAVSAQDSTFQKGKHRLYKVVVLPPDGGPDSFLAGYLFYAPMNTSGSLGVAADTSTPGVLNSYIWADGKQTDLQALQPFPNSGGSAIYVNWINQWGLAAGYGTRINSATGADNAVIWGPNGQAFALSTPAGDQSHAVWINNWGQASGWIENSTPDSCVFGVGVGFQSQAVVWEWGIMRPLGTLGGTDSYGEFINDRGQIVGHSQTSNTTNMNTGCPPFDPFIWQNGQMIDINPGNFGGGVGGTNFLNNRGQAVGFGSLSGDVDFHPFLWEEGRLTDLFTIGNLGGGIGSAFNVNEKGHVIGLSSLPGDQVFHAVRWSNGEFTDLGTLEGDPCSQPLVINSKDQIVGVSGPCDFSTTHAFLWENGEMVNLDMLIPPGAGIQLNYAGWVSERGEIAAQGVLTASGATRAVLLIPDGDCDHACQAGITASRESAAATPHIVGAPTLTAEAKAQLRTGPLRPMAPGGIHVQKPN